MGGGRGIDALGGYFTMANVKSRLTSVDTRLGLVHTDMAHQSERLDRLEGRLGRVETRLNLTDQRQ